MENGPIIKANLINWKPEAFMNITSSGESNLADMIQENGEKLIIIINGEKYSIEIRKEEE